METRRTTKRDTILHMEAGFYADFCRRAGCGIVEEPEPNCIQAKISHRDARATEFLPPQAPCAQPKYVTCDFLVP